MICIFLVVQHMVKTKCQRLCGCVVSIMSDKLEFRFCYYIFQTCIKIFSPMCGTVCFN